MVRHTKMVDVYSQEADEANEPDIETYNDDDDDDDDVITEDTAELKHEVTLEREECPGIVEEEQSRKR